MKKAGIITLFGEYNHGNRLQNYAVQETLKKIGLDVETIKYIPLKYKINLEKNEICKRRLKKFKKFNENIKFANEIMYRENEVPNSIKNDYDYFIIGSDQIWNFTFKSTFSEKSFAPFAQKSKKISFSASFGVNHVPEEKDIYQICKENLEDMKAISVREDAGKKIVEELTDRKDVKVLIDPTMMLTSEEWEKIMKKPENLKTDKYIIKNFLGEIPEEYEKELSRIARENECEIIDISDDESQFYDIGPSEFLYLEKNAFLVATDSFHACVFSILFNTPFLVFKRVDNNLESMYSRIETLLSTFNLEDRIFKENIRNEILSSNYEEAYKILKEKRIEAMLFLKNAIN